MKNKKGAIQDVQALVVPLVGIAVVLVVGFLIFAESKAQIISIQGAGGLGQTTDHPNGTPAFNATNEVINSIATIPGWLPIIIITVIGSILLGLVAFFRKR